MDDGSVSHESSHLVPPFTNSTSASKTIPLQSKNSQLVVAPEAKMTSSLVKSVDVEGHKTINAYRVIGTIGSGQYGKVKLLESTETKSKFAVKILNKSILKRIHKGPGKNAYMGVLKEIAIWKKLHHPNVVQLFEVIDDPHRDKLYLITEYVEKGCIATCKRNSVLENGPLPEDQVRKYMWGILEGLSYLHAHRVIHRDLKPENILVTATDEVKLADFGVSDMFEGDDDETRATDGTPAFMPPEAFEMAKFSGRKADIWSLGVTLYLLLVGYMPFAGRSYMDICNAILHAEPQYPARLSPDAVDLLKRLLKKDATSRISLDHVRQHRWVAPAGSICPISPAGYKTQHVVVTKEDIEGAVSQGKKTRSVDRLGQIIRIQNPWAKYIKSRRARAESTADTTARRSSLQDSTPSTSLANTPISGLGTNSSCSNSEVGEFAHGIGSYKELSMSLPPHALGAAISTSEMAVVPSAETMSSTRRSSTSSSASSVENTSLPVTSLRPTTLSDSNGSRYAKFEETEPNIANDESERSEEDIRVDGITDHHDAVSNSVR
eukprot:ANDGO_04088.mRNA.1 putative serine/threonine-protein kinase DDB_G0279405